MPQSQKSARDKGGRMWPLNCLKIHHPCTLLTLEYLLTTLYAKRTSLVPGLSFIVFCHYKILNLFFLKIMIFEWIIKLIWNLLHILNHISFDFWNHNLENITFTVSFIMLLLSWITLFSLCYQNQLFFESTIFFPIFNAWNICHSKDY